MNLWRLAAYTSAAAVLLAGCDSPSITSDGESTIAPIGVPAPTSSPAGEDARTDEVSPPLVSGGCARFDPEMLGRLTELPVPLSLVTEEGTGDRLYCGLIGEAGGRNAGTVIVVEPVTQRTAASFRTAAETETELIIGGLPAIGAGRGEVRIQLDAATGLTVTVTLRTQDIDVAPYSDAEHAAIRDAVAAYVIGELVRAN